MWGRGLSSEVLPPCLHYVGQVKKNPRRAVGGSESPHVRGTERVAGQVEGGPGASQNEAWHSNGRRTPAISSDGMAPNAWWLHALIMRPPRAVMVLCICCMPAIRWLYTCQT